MFSQSIRRNFYFLALSALLVISSCAKKPALTLDLDGLGQNLATDIIMLSTDAMEGREIGTAGEIMASEYISSRFAAVGLKPAGDNSTYYQAFEKKKSGNPHGDESGDAGTIVKGRNVIGYIDNKASATVIIGGHYDHLGYGAEGSLHTGELAIHNGADDNASGVGGVIYLAEWIKTTGLKKYNYLFICFSGEEKGLWGSNFFINNYNLKYKPINYMINMDMIGRLNKERVLAVSGIGTAAAFETIIDNVATPKITIKKDYSGLGPSDHASFYNAGIPVLAYFTGQHSDYHKPSDDSPLINYSGTRDILSFIYQNVVALEKIKKLTFVKTKDDSQTRMAFKVTLGLMPDYLYGGLGMKIDGVKIDRPAQRAGLIKGDTITKMGDLPINNMDDYMKGLSMFDEGSTIMVEYIRDGKPQVTKVTF